MATIILRPNEKFEHKHSAPSITTLIQGDLVYHSNGKKITLNLGETIDTPANQAHIVENIGQTEAIFLCDHSI